MKHIVVGGISFILGLIGLITWWKTFGLVMRGVLPFTMLLLGVVALLSGWRRVSAAQAVHAREAANSEVESDKAA